MSRADGVRRILFIEANEDGTVGGSHQVLFDLARTLDTTRYEPLVLFYQRNLYVERLQALGITTLDFEEVRARERRINESGSRPAKLKKLVDAIRVRRRFLRDHEVDLVHINNSPKVGNDDWLPAARLARIPCIVNVAGDARGDTGRIRKWLFRRFDHYLPVSGFIASAMERHGIAPSRMDLIHPGVDIAAFQARMRRERREVRAELGVPDDALLALMVGNIREWKGQHVVLEALAGLDHSTRDRIHIAFAGATTQADEPFLARLRGMARDAGIERQVSFLGSRQDVPDLLNAADLAIHSSIRPEPFGLVIIEAMAAGRAVIAANTGGPAEIVAEGSGLIHNPLNPEELRAHLAALEHDRGRLEALGAGARRRSAEFTVEAFTGRVQAVYGRVLGA